MIDKKKNSLLLMFNVSIIALSMWCLFYLYGVMQNLSGSYIFLLIPSLILFMIVIMAHFIKSCSLLGLLMINEDNVEQIQGLVHTKERVDEVLRCSLIVVFIILLLVMVILDVILCVMKQEYLMLLFSLSGWLLMIYLSLRVLLK